MPPKTTLELLSDPLHSIPKFFMSGTAVIGLRITCATMTVAIIGLLERTQIYYLDQHLLWAQYVVGLVMQCATGQSWRKFLFRIIGTGLAVLSAIISWYAGGQTAGGCLIWIPLMAEVGRVPMFTLGIILGLVLQNRKDQSAHLAQAAQQPYLGVLRVGGLRLAAICGGLFAGWFWTIFPYPISDKDLSLRRLATCMFKLATYNEATFILLLNPSVIEHLEQLCSSCYVNIMSLTDILRAELGFIAFELPIGAPFPRTQYQAVVQHIDQVVSRLQLINIASGSIDDFIHSFEPTTDLSRACRQLYDLAQTVEWSTTIFTIQSQNIASAMPIPPYIRTPTEFLTQANLEKVPPIPFDPLEPGYLTMLAVHQWECNICHATSQILEHIREASGVLDICPV